MDNDTSEIIETLNVILSKMATKDDIDRLDGRIDSLRDEMHEGFVSTRADIREIRDEVREIHARLDAIEAELKNYRGFAKEIDHILQRVAAIEKHLGLEQKIAA